MKKGFTLVELLIVVVVLVILMTIAFRLGGIGDETTKRNRTINRMQRLENCLSGYYAAYGSYPPVKLHGSRDYTYKVNTIYELQCIDTDEHETELTWASVKAACKSQPLAMCWPISRSKEKYVNALSQMYKKTDKQKNSRHDFYALCDNSTISALADKKDWADVHVFMFGALSYLVPRYLIVMGGGDSASDTDSQLFMNQEQWKANNQLPCRFESGVPYEDWSKVCQDVFDEPWKIAVLQSQAVCARWLPNLEKTIATTFPWNVYGVELQADDDEGQNREFPVYDASQLGSGGSGSSGNGQNYALNKMTVCDGWGHEFYYYSLPPHQSYTLWSGGANEKTFPPWVDINTLEKKYQPTVQDWVSDDIIQMSN